MGDLFVAHHAAKVLGVQSRFALIDLCRWRMHIPCLPTGPLPGVPCVIPRVPLAISGPTPIIDPDSDGVRMYIARDRASLEIIKLEFRNRHGDIVESIRQHMADIYCCIMEYVFLSSSPISSAQHAQPWAPQVLETEPRWTNVCRGRCHARGAYIV